MDFLEKILDTDTEIFLHLNSYHNDYWDTIMLMVTRKEIWLPFFAVILFFIFKNYRSKSLLILIFVAVTILLSDQLSVFLKETIQRLRPVHDPRIQHLVHNVFRKGGLYGFVSSHATNTFSIFFFTSRLFKNRGYTLLLLFWAALVSYSRIYLGVHYPGDILGGILLGWLIAFVVYKIFIFLEVHIFLTRYPQVEKTNLKPRQAGLVYLVFCVLTVTVISVVSILHYYNWL